MTPKDFKELCMASALSLSCLDYSEVIPLLSATYAQEQPCITFIGVICSTEGLSCLRTMQCLCCNEAVGHDCQPLPALGQNIIALRF